HSSRCMRPTAKRARWPAAWSQRSRPDRARPRCAGRPAGTATRARPATLAAMSWVLTILGIVLLIVLHELGHFAVAKAVGMRVERFSLFFPPKLFGFKRGETEYMIGAIPAGGYVKITGMNPEELGDLDPEASRRAYYAQPPWRPLAVILAGPGG